MSHPYRKELLPYPVDEDGNGLDRGTNRSKGRSKEDKGRSKDLLGKNSRRSEGSGTGYYDSSTIKQVADYKSSQRGGAHSTPGSGFGYENDSNYGNQIASTGGGSFVIGGDNSGQEYSTVYGQEPGFGKGPGNEFSGQNFSDDQTYSSSSIAGNYGNITASNPPTLARGAPIDVNYQDNNQYSDFHPQNEYNYPESNYPVNYNPNSNFNNSAPEVNNINPSDYNQNYSNTSNSNYNSNSYTNSPKFHSSGIHSPRFDANNNKNLNLHSIISPKESSPLSATSSILNLNDGLTSNFSKSETNLGLPARKFNHSRSVSSTSSFFYDRQSDNVSMVDFNQNLIQQYLGNNSTNLLPRIKTIELYRKNAKKSSDPKVLFQYAQYILQTALLLDDKKTDGLSSSQSNQINPQISQTGLADEKKFKQALIKESTTYLKRLSDKGYSEAQYLLADAYSSGAFGKIDNREAFSLFVHAAKHGHIESAFRTAHCYEEGLGTGRDARKAIDYLKIAAAKNHPAAMYKLGVYSFNSRMGLPSNMNTKKAGIQWLTRATNLATELVAAAPYELGKIYYNGFEDIVIEDKKYALELYSKAAALGHIPSAAILGACYESGDIVPQDGNLSIHYYTQAALGGDPEAMLSMCAWYLVGCDPHLPKDENEAFEWAKRAATYDLPKAQFALANFYEKGIGCIKNISESQNWYRKAALNGDESSCLRITDQKILADIKSKKIKKKPNSSTNKTSNSAEDKDCIIM